MTPEKIEKIKKLFSDVLKENNIRVELIKLSPRVLGLVYRSRKGNYHIIINKNITWEMQQLVLIHELKHVKYDIPRIPYIIGLDMQFCVRERRADNFIYEIAASNKLK